MKRNVMEFGALKEKHARGCLTNIADALAYIRQMQIVHRDVKPENILLEDTEREVMTFKLCNFGLSRHSSGNRDCKTFCGTPQYMSLEVVMTRPEASETMYVGYDYRTDLWSLGVVLYVVLCAEEPFDNEGLFQEILEGHVDVEDEPWQGISTCAKSLVLRLMCHKPAERMTARDAVIYSLQCWLARD